MPHRDHGVYLEDIEHYAAAAVSFTSGFSLEVADEKARAGVSPPVMSSHRDDSTSGLQVGVE
jgi:hypothetical protein